jgi:hypothetical protein
MDVGDWQKRLEEIFSFEGVVGGRLLKIIDAEKSFGAHITETYLGHLFLIDSFFDFYIESIQNAISWTQNHGWPEGKTYYAYNILYNVTNFKSFRAADILFINGYPFDGYSLLRDLKDRSIFLGSIIHQYTNFSLLEGIERFKAASLEEMQKTEKILLPTEKKNKLEYMI